MSTIGFVLMLIASMSACKLQVGNSAMKSEEENSHSLSSPIRRRNNMDVAEMERTDDSGDLHLEEADHDPNPLDDEMEMSTPDEEICCPICLCELDTIREAGSDSEETNQVGIPIFTLASCRHKYCAPCLRAYIQSKLVGGDIDISCCHFQPRASDETEVDCCNTAITRCDIERLIHMDYFGGDSYESYWHSGSAQDCNKTSDELWAKFKKLEFDRLHGKDAVRRCPSCDEAALFDVDEMKLHQTQFESTSSENAISGTARPKSNNRARFDRFFRRVQQTASSTDVAAAATATTAATAAAITEATKTDFNAIDDAEAIQADKEVVGQSEVLGLGEELQSEERANEQIADNSVVKSKSPVITCSSCSTEFCYFHSNAHQGQSCLAYHSATLEEDRTNIEFATRVLRVKPCPNCGISVSKDGGCNQIKCSGCNTHFCWLCGTTIDDSPFPDHFRWWNINGCPNMQLDESAEPRQAILVGARMLSILQLLILGVPAVALSIVSMLVCPCMVPGCGSNMRERVINCVSFWGSFLSSLIMLPFTLLGLFLLTCLYCFLGAISCCFKVPKNNASSRQGDNQTATQTASDNTVQRTSTEELIRELENIFVRLEEGNLREGSELFSMDL